MREAAHCTIARLLGTLREAIGRRLLHRDQTRRVRVHRAPHPAVILPDCNSRCQPKLSAAVASEIAQRTAIDIVVQDHLIVRRHQVQRRLPRVGFVDVVCIGRAAVRVEYRLTAAAGTRLGSATRNARCSCLWPATLTRVVEPIRATPILSAHLPRRTAKDAGASARGRAHRTVSAFEAARMHTPPPCAKTCRAGMPASCRAQSCIAELPLRSGSRETRKDQSFRSELFARMSVPTLDCAVRWQQPCGAPARA
jgi:hypothetical protein